MDKNTIKERGQDLDPVIRIGKAGLTENVITEIRKHLRKRKVIKVKILRSFLEGKDKKEAFRQIADLSGGDLIDHRGFTLLLSRKGELSLYTNAHTKDDR